MNKVGWTLTRIRGSSNSDSTCADVFVDRSLCGRLCRVASHHEPAPAGGDDPQRRKEVQVPGSVPGEQCPAGGRRMRGDVEVRQRGVSGATQAPVLQEAAGSQGGGVHRDPPATHPRDDCRSACLVRRTSRTAPNVLRDGDLSLSRHAHTPRLVASMTQRCYPAGTDATGRLSSAVAFHRCRSDRVLSVGQLRRARQALVDSCRHYRDGS